MDTTIKCNSCSREMGLVEFLTYPKAYFMKLMAPALASFVAGAIGYRLSAETRGIVDGTMSGRAKNFSITCPNCENIDWYPVFGKKPKKIKQKNSE